MSVIDQIRDLREERAQKLDAMRLIAKNADERRSLSHDEENKFGRLERQAERLNTEIAALEADAPLKPNPAINRAALPQQAEQRGGREDATLAGWASRSVFESTGGGQYLVPDQYAGTLWDRLAASSVGLQSGFTVMETGTDTLHIPTLTADAAANWVAEGAAITPTDPTFAEVVATPRKLAALVQISNEVRRDSNPSVVDATMTNLMRSVALKLDLGFYEGSGTPPEIKGMKNVSGINTVTTLGANGGTPTSLDAISDAVATLAAANAEATAIVMAPRTWGTLSKLKTGVTGDQRLLLGEVGGFDSSGGFRRSLLGIPVYLSGQLSITETRGTSTDTSSVYVYQADQVVAVRRLGVEIQMDGSRLFNQDQSEVRATCRWDLVVPNPTAVARIVGFRP